MPVLLSDEELEALEGLPHLHRCLYIFGIRRYMDYSTGITGIKRKISYKSLSEEVYVIPHQGLIDSGAKSREAIRRAVKALEKAGLITIKSNDKNLILICNLALRDKSVQNKPDTNPTPQPNTKADTTENKEKHYKNSMFHLTAENKPDTQADIPQNEKPDTHPVSGKDTKLNYTKLPDFLSTNENKFLNLFTDLKLSLNLAGDLKAITTAKALVQAGVTLEVAAEALKIKLAAYKGDRTPHPSYFKDAIINYKNELEAIKSQTQETQHATNRPTTTVPKPDSRRDRYKKILR